MRCPNRKQRHRHRAWLFVVCLGVLPACDRDHDGWRRNADCDDSNGSVHPGAPEICDGLDQDCDGRIDDGLFDDWYRDADGDGFAVPSGNDIRCAAEPGFTDRVGDCDDSDATRSPVATETCNGVDDDCDGQTDEVASCG